jgi:peptidoglycan/LPS O-acetylase OafA/YrhL
MLVLDAIRGIAALVVVLHHVPGWNTLTHDVTLFRNGYLMVPLFFVLSGYVIFSAYDGRLRSPREALSFQTLRLGRLYPVHLLFLAVFLAIEGAKWLYFNHHELKPGYVAPFSHNSIGAMVQHLTLTQAILPSGKIFTFNVPAWSISTEFYAYAVFALASVAFSGYRHIAFAILCVAAFIGYASPALEAFRPFLGCVGGFFLGCLTALAANRYHFRLPAGVAAGALALLVATVSVPQFVGQDFAVYGLITVLILGLIGSSDTILHKVLSHRSLLWLGAISYSLYMSHVTVLWAFNSFVRVVLKRPEANVEGLMTPQLGPLESVGASLLALAACIAFAGVIYTWVESPGRRWSRRLVLGRADR